MRPKACFLNRSAKLTTLQLVEPQTTQITIIKDERRDITVNFAKIKWIMKECYDNFTPKNQMTQMKWKNFQKTTNFQEWLKKKQTI